MNLQQPLANWIPGWGWGAGSPVKVLGEWRTAVSKCLCVQRTHFWASKQQGTSRIHYFPAVPLCIAWSQVGGGEGSKGKVLGSRATSYGVVICTWFSGASLQINVFCFVFLLIVCVCMCWRSQVGRWGDRCAHVFVGGTNVLQRANSASYLSWMSAPDL